MSDLEEPTAEEAKEFFGRLEQKFPVKTLGKERWYLVAVSLSFLRPIGTINLMPN